jgi:hypothetical protein
MRIPPRRQATDVSVDGKARRWQTWLWRRLADSTLPMAIASLQIAISGAVDTTTANALRLRPLGVTQGGGSDTPVLRISEELSRGGAQFTVLANGRQLDGTADADHSRYASGAASVSANARFNVSGGQIIGPSGQPFKAHGVNILESTLGSVVGNANGGALLRNFPATNMVRIAMESGYHSYNNPAFINAVNWLTAKGIVVEIGNYNTNGGVATGQVLTDEVNWFAALASKYKSNPYVWFSTDNEPTDGKTYNGATTAEQLAAYKAIRSAGNTTMIGIEDTFATLNSANYAKMTNIHWDSHYYNWNAGYSTDVATNEAAIRRRNTLLNSLFKSADGTIPIISGEFGNSTNGSTIDPGGAQAIQAVLNVSPSYSGWTAWLYYWPGNYARGMTGDELTNENTGQLTPYGRQIAAAQMGQPPQGPALPRTSP